jgi:hypothetical protein
MLGRDAVGKGLGGGLGGAVRAVLCRSLLCHRCDKRTTEREAICSDAEETEKLAKVSRTAEVNSLAVSPTLRFAESARALCRRNNF